MHTTAYSHGYPMHTMTSKAEREICIIKNILFNPLNAQNKIAEFSNSINPDEASVSSLVFEIEDLTQMVISYDIYETSLWRV